MNGTDCHCSYRVQVLRQDFLDRRLEWQLLAANGAMATLGESAPTLDRS
ncbi:hypothetical protein JX360_01335 [Synechococcus bigranulatus str. 'Rupite']|uniref:Uncharacterized protein n=1 Tax=Thermostichus vulcanus str. 'Rupite' TaxID=2813851 RepID=A0ABT0C708_THEVL|nr:hypothetical protein [Thermostichus vulcanus str. 'Rupite']